MSSFGDLWDEHMARLSRAPVWLPGTTMALGDIGIMEKRGYLRLTSLADLGLAFTETHSDVKSEYYVTSERASSSEVQLTADAPTASPAAQVGAEMRVTLSGGAAFVVRAKSVRGASIQNVLAVESEIRSRQAVEAFWDKRWIYIQEIVTAQPCVVVMSTGAAGEAVVGASGSISTGSFATLFEGGARLAVKQQSSSLECFVSPDRAPFMWRGRWLRGLFQQKFADRGRTDELPDADDELFEDFDDPSVVDSAATGDD